MPLALILSSHVAGSRVGGFPQALALAQWGIDPVLVPTVLFGRRPGRGQAPGGGPVDDALFRGMLDGVEAHGLFGLFDAVITGYFASADQVRAAAEAIDRIRAAGRAGAFGPALTVVVDPIMGDEPDGLYVREEVAEAIQQLLISRADVLTPNVWELARLTGSFDRTPEALVGAARGLGRPVLVTSVPLDGARIGAVFADADGALLFSHQKLAGVPHGTGDLVTIALATRMVGGLRPALAAGLAIKTVTEAVAAAARWGALELPVVALGGRLRNPSARLKLRIERLDGRGGPRWLQP